MDAELHERVLAIYRDADAAVAAAGPRCDASGRCCRFVEFDHALYLSEIEAEVLLASAPAFAQVTPAFCPFQVENLCTARAERPLGCRVYFCDPGFRERMPEIMEVGISQLKKLTQAAGRDWRYAPLHVFLQEALDSGRPTAEPTSRRRPLPLAGPGPVQASVQ